MITLKNLINGSVAGLVLSVAVGSLTLPSIVEARGFGGVGRGGPAAGGTIRTRPVVRPGRSAPARTTPGRPAPAARGASPGDRRDFRTERRDDVRDVRRERYDNVGDVRKERYEHRHDYRKERHEWYEDRWKRRTIGGTLTLASFSSLTCTTTTVVVGGVTYYRCGNDWYQRAYRSSEVVYIIVEAPSGY